MSRFIYVLVPNTNSNWNQITILLNQKEAYATSIIHPTYRIELFVIGPHGYEPTNDYIQNGKYMNLLENPVVKPVVMPLAKL
jgi:hypothetical protein